MVSLPTVKELLEALLENLLVEMFRVVQVWWDDVRDSLNTLLSHRWNPIRFIMDFGRHMIFIVTRFFTLIDQLLSAPIGAVYLTIADIARRVVPKEWATQALSKKRAWLDATDAMIEGAQAAGTLQLPFGGRIYLWISKVQSFVKLGHSGFSLTGIFKFLMGTIVTLILKVIDILLKFVAVLAALTCLYIFWVFTRDVLTGLKLRAFQQKTPRVKWDAMERGTKTLSVIRRRNDGGNPP